MGLTQMHGLGDPNGRRHISALAPRWPVFIPTDSYRPREGGALSHGYSEDGHKEQYMCDI